MHSEFKSDLFSLVVSKVKGTGMELVIISELTPEWLNSLSSPAEKAEVLPSVAKQFCSAGFLFLGVIVAFSTETKQNKTKKPGYLFKNTVLRKWIRFHFLFSEMMCPFCLPELLVYWSYYCRCCPVSKYCVLSIWFLPTCFFSTP